MALPGFRMFKTYWSAKGPSTFFAASYRTSARSISTPLKRRQIPWQFSQRRTAAYSRGFNYQRFQQAGGLFQRWAARPTFYYEVGGIGAVCSGFYVYNLEEVPVRFVLVTPIGRSIH